MIGVYKLRNLITAAALVLMSTAAFAKDDKPDYLKDKETYACENEQLADHLKILYSDSNDLIRVVYVKGASEVSRTADGVKCKITLVHQRGKLNGIVHYHYEDGHALYGFKPTGIGR
jgi:hypothetical protein